VSRYELLLRELRKLTPADHEDHEQLDLSLEFMKDCNEQINVAIGAAKRRARSRTWTTSFLVSKQTYAACKMPPLCLLNAAASIFGLALSTSPAQSVRHLAAAGPGAVSGQGKEKKLKHFDCIARKLLVLSDRLVLICKDSRKDWRVTVCVLLFPAAQCVAEC